MKIKLLENMSKTSGTNKSISFELVSEINDDDIYTFDSEFVPFEEATDIFIDTVKIKYENAFIDYTKKRCLSRICVEQFHL